MKCCIEIEQAQLKMSLSSFPWSNEKSGSEKASNNRVNLKIFYIQLTIYGKEHIRSGMGKHPLAFCYKTLVTPKEDFCPITVRIWERALEVKFNNYQNGKNTPSNALWGTE